jgi:hypothetical protein
VIDGSVRLDEYKNLGILDHPTFHKMKNEELPINTQMENFSDIQSTLTELLTAERDRGDKPAPTADVDGAEKLSEPPGKDAALGGRATEGDS